MTAVYLVHNRPRDNNCFDDFVERVGPAARDQGVDLRYVYWESPWRAEPGDLVACCLQDPIGPKKRAVIHHHVASGTRVLNHYNFINNALRETAYPTWAAHGLPCPAAPQAFFEGALPPFPFIVKETGKQMGRGFLINSERRLQWLLTKSKRFRRDRFRVLKYHDIRTPDGYHTLHRYLVCGDQVKPVVFAKTKNWCCKASHMVRDVKRWDAAQRQRYRDELEAFWASTPSPQIVQSVRLLGLDFALVDTSIQKDGTPFFWEVNPYANLRPAEATGKPEVWWPMFARLLGVHLPVGLLDSQAYLDNLLSWQGYKLHWRARLDQARISAEGA